MLQVHRTGMLKRLAHSTFVLPLSTLLFGTLLGLVFLVSPLAGFALIGVLMSLYFLIPYPLRVACILIAAILLTSAMPRGQVIPLLKVNELILIMAFITLLFEGMTRHKAATVPGTPLVASIILVTGTSLVPMVIYQLRGITLDIEERLDLLAPLQYLGLFWFFAVIAKTTQQRHTIIQFMFLCCSVIALVGLLQAAKIDPVMSFLNTSYPSEHTSQSIEVGRMTSVMGAWNVLGTLMMASLVVALAIQHNLDRPIFRLNTLVMVLLSLPCLIATNYYASILGLVLGLLIWRIAYPRGLKIIIPILPVVAATVIVLWPMVSARFSVQFSNGDFLPSTIRYRVAVWEDYYIPEIRKSFAWGVSPTSNHILFESPESQYIYLLYRSGLISLLSHFLWIGILLRWLFGIIREKNGLASRLSVSVMALLIILSVMGLINPVFTYSGTIDLLWINLGLVVSERMWGQ